MAAKLNFRKKDLINKIRLRILYLVVQGRIFIIESLSGRNKRLRMLIPLFFGILFGLSLLIIPCLLFAQSSPWPWTLKGESFQITGNSSDDFRTAISANGYLYFVVWSRQTENGFDIYGARVHKNGLRLDGQEIAICSEPGDQLFPSVSWNGENFLVVWEDNRNGKRWDIYGAFVSPKGWVVKEFPVSIGRSTYDQATPSVAFDGENHMVVWQGKRNSRTWNIFLNLITKNGNSLLAKAAQLAPSFKDQAYPSVAFDGENYMIVWQDKRNGKFWDIYGARVNPHGEILDSKGFQVTFTEGYDRWMPVLSWNGSHYLAVWTGTPEKDKSLIYGKRISMDGNVIDIQDLPTQNSEINQASPAVAWDGEEFLSVWEEDPAGDSMVFSISIQSQYRISLSEQVAISSNGGVKASKPVVDVIGNEALIVWQEKQPGSDNKWNIIGQIIKKVDKPSTNRFQQAE